MMDDLLTSNLKVPVALTSFVYNVSLWQGPEAPLENLVLSQAKEEQQRKNPNGTHREKNNFPERDNFINQ